MLAIWNAIRNATPLQILGAILVLNSAATDSVNELTDLFGQVWARHLLSIAVIGSGICGGLVTMFGGQGAVLRNVASIQGDDGRPALRINVNANAPRALAAAAVDPAQKNIGAANPETRTVLLETAKGA